ncbi:hypothetical protein GCM10011519_27770 [Marmoricola endophyticus]|uniref:Uncharacterized protein n=1 Tax=Marmoricola endophyticus TaxID=2040280 RepID=A0A917BPD2_9ACTN|nr:hypothetical protein [Marmoricola endophyticus]GGF52231.1 hypothetical protein GCM10011519_27770 [Marmoricola endophyticus]
MSEDVADSSGAERRREAQRAAARRRRLDEVFGTTMPEQTSDDVDATGPDAGGRGDTWLREQVPPHHGG